MDSAELARMIDPHLTPHEAHIRLQRCLGAFAETLGRHGDDRVTEALGTVSYTAYHAAFRESIDCELAVRVMQLVEEAGWTYLNSAINQRDTDADTDTA